MFGQTEFGGFIWFSYVALIITLLIGYFILRTQKDKKKRRGKIEEKTKLERELQAEIDAAANRSSLSAPMDEHHEELALEPPREVRERLEEIRRQGEE